MIRLVLMIVMVGVLPTQVVLATSALAQSRDENRVRCESKNPELSIGGCTALIQSGQESPENLAVFFNTRALAYRAKGDTDRAIQDYDAAIRLKPDYAPAFNYRGNAYVASGANDRGIKDYDQAIRLKPDYDVAFNNRGFTYLKMQRYASAIADYDVALRIDGKRANSLYGRALAHRALGNTAMADADMAAAKQIKGDIEQVFVGYGIVGR